MQVHLGFWAFSAVGASVCELKAAANTFRGQGDQYREKAQFWARMAAGLHISPEVSDPVQLVAANSCWNIVDP